MKPILLLGAFLCSVGLFAQDCNTYYFMQNNKTIEMAILNKKGEQSAKQVYTVSNVNTSGNSSTADLESEMFDKKGKSMAKGKAKIKCDGGVMMMDMKMSIPQQPGVADAPAAESDVKAENVYMEYPNNMNVGDNLKNASMHLDMNNNGMKQTIDMDVFDRKVEAKEKVTTPAGSWDCYKISYKSKMKIKTMGIGMPMNIEGTEYFAPGFGIVKTQSKSGGTEIVSIK